MPHQPCHDLAVVGAAPAGLTSTVYEHSEGRNTLVVKHTAIAGQAGTAAQTSSA
jgi:thioredoxin reductase